MCICKTRTSANAKNSWQKTGKKYKKVCFFVPRAPSADADAPARRAALPRVDPLALFEEANSRMLVSSEHALAKMLHELADANLVAVHADGGVAVAVDAAALKDALRTALRGTR